MQELMDEIAIMQYEGSLKDSCINAFPNLHLVDKDNTLNEAMARIRMQEGKKVLALVDNMNSTLEEDPDLAQLLTLSETVSMTSLEGVTIYEVKALGREPGIPILAVLTIIIWYFPRKEQILWQTIVWRKAIVV